MIWVSCTAASGMSLHFYANTTSWFTFNYSSMSGRQACGWDWKGNPSRTERCRKRPERRVGTAPKSQKHFSNFSSFFTRATDPVLYNSESVYFFYWKRIKKIIIKPHNFLNIHRASTCSFPYQEKTSTASYYYLQWSTAKTQMHHWAYLVMNQSCWRGTLHTITLQAWMFIQPLNVTLLRAPAPVRIMWELSTWMVLCPSLTR